MLYLKNETEQNEIQKLSRLKLFAIIFKNYIFLFRFI